MLSKKDRVLIKVLRVEKRIWCYKIMNEYPRTKTGRLRPVRLLNMTAAVFVIWIFGWFYLEFNF